MPQCKICPPFDGKMLSMFGIAKPMIKPVKEFPTKRCKVFVLEYSKKYSIAMGFSAHAKKKIKFKF